MIPRADVYTEEELIYFFYGFHRDFSFFMMKRDLIWSKKTFSEKELAIINRAAPK